MQTRTIMSKNTILVTTATGNVGGHIVTLLLEQGFNVNALVRNPDSEAAQKLKAQGVTLFKGDFDDVPSIEAAAEGVYGVFINTVPNFANMDEYKHNSNIITAAKKAGAKIAVYMSVDVQEAGFDHWTIIRPAMFLSNFHTRLASYMWPLLQKEHKFVYSPLDLNYVFSVVDTLDVGKFCAAPFWDTKTFDKQMIDLRTEDVALSKLAEIMTKATGIPINAELVSREEAKTKGVPDAAYQWEDWQVATGYKIDTERLKSFPIKLSSTEAYFDRNKDKAIQFLSQ
ncbi:hypothetical protein INT43_008366 [Umbelopsis isabellina]|uniref:NmrA-like domain-containing protein n=1 Tax=Mortierella isabellina TaxID=91625 RepID=A0A8H7PDE2_MORIS|nr:hypothetical protein INT43_008366 [Umbelopsis isabellina]